MRIALTFLAALIVSGLNAQNLNDKSGTISIRKASGESSTDTSKIIRLGDQAFWAVKVESPATLDALPNNISYYAGISGLRQRPYRDVSKYKVRFSRPDSTIVFTADNPFITKEIREQLDYIEANGGTAKFYSILKQRTVGNGEPLPGFEYTVSIDQ